MNDDLDLKSRTEGLYVAQLFDAHARTDKRFAKLLLVEWAVAVVLAVFISPQTWIGSSASPHMHLYAGIVLGGIIAVPPAYLGFVHGGAASTRHAIAVAQLCFCGLAIHLSGGRIETHFFIFASLAFLATYRDFHVMVTATVVTALDHGVRGIFFPESVFGLMSPDILRIVEHASYVLVEVGFLFFSIRDSLAEVRTQAEQRAAIEGNDRTLALVQELEVEREQIKEAGAAAARRSDEQRVFLEETGHVLHRLASKDLRGRINPNDRAEFQAIADSFNNAAATIEAGLSNVKATSRHARRVADQLDDSSTTAASDARQQAEALREVASRLAELSESSKESAQLTEQARAMARVAREVTEEARTHADHAAIAIARIRDAAHETSTIIKTVDGLAFQTKLLALNAAVEAARAGDAGRGFAVVADEVGQLAQKSAQAARQTAERIEEALRRTQEGVRAGEHLQRSFEAIDEQVSDVEATIGHLSEAAEVQRSGVSSSSALSSEAAKNTERSAAVARESSERAQEVRGALDELTRMVDTFELGENASPLRIAS